MCQSKAEGGQRCEYADTLANVRRQAARKHAHTKEYSLSSYNEKVDEHVRAWQAENPEIVMAHLPQRQPFQVAPGKLPVPDEVMQMFTVSTKDPISGFPKDQRIEHTKALHAEHEEWEASLSDREPWSVRYYAMYGFQSINAYTRRKGFARWAKETLHVENPVESTKKHIQDLDSALAKAPRPAEPRKLYRFFRVPAGVTPQEYMKRYIEKGEGFKDPGYMSTTADPEFIMAHMEERNGGRKNKGYIVMEIISKQGASLQPRPYSTSGNIQSLEKEVLLPRNMKLRIVGSRNSQKFTFASDRDDLQKQYHENDYWSKHYREGDAMRFPIIQMVDEDLITEHHRNNKKEQ